MKRPSHRNADRGQTPVHDGPNSYPQSSTESARESLDELAELARSAGAVVAGSMLQMRDAVDPATVVGNGKLDEIRAEAQRNDARSYFRSQFHADCSATSSAIECRVIDRTQLILDIFARRAQRRRPAAGGTGAAQVSAAAADRTGVDSRGSAAASVRAALAKETRNRPTPHSRARSRIAKRSERVRRQRALRRSARKPSRSARSRSSATRMPENRRCSTSDVAPASWYPKMFATLDPTVRAVDYRRAGARCSDTWDLSASFRQRCSRVSRHA